MQPNPLRPDVLKGGLQIKFYVYGRTEMAPMMYITYYGHVLIIIIIPSTHTQMAAAQDPHLLLCNR